MDNSVKRRGKDCWYRKDNLGLPAVNDGILMEAGIYKLLKLHCRSEPYYASLIELFHNVRHSASLRGGEVDVVRCSERVGQTGGTVGDQLG